MPEYSVFIECPATVRADSVEVAATLIEDALEWSEGRECRAICTELDDGGDGPDEVTEHPDGSVSVSFDLYVRFLDYLSDEDQARNQAVAAAQSLVADLKVFIDGLGTAGLLSHTFALDLGSVEVTDMAREKPE